MLFIFILSEIVVSPVCPRILRIGRRIHHAVLLHRLHTQLLTAAALGLLTTLAAYALRPQIKYSIGDHAKQHEYQQSPEYDSDDRYAALGIQNCALEPNPVLAVGRRAVGRFDPQLQQIDLCIGL